MKMASLPNPNQVAGKHIAIYEAYYKQVDPKCTGTIEAMVAAKFLKKSGLSDVVLSRIWDLSDPTGKGFLDKAGLFVALKLVSLAQSGHDINIRNLFMETNAPRVGDIPKIPITTTIQNIPPSTTDWSMKLADREKYEKLYESLQPINGLIPGNKVKGVLMDSKLPLDTLGKIWDLADQDADGSLDKHEFTVAMHLVYQALDKRAIPTSLPVELQRPVAPPKSIGFNDAGADFVANFPQQMTPPEIPPLPASIPPMSRLPPSTPNISNVALIESTLIPTKPPPPQIDWVVTPKDKIRYDAIFATSDLDRDGLVSGMEIKDVFLKSGVPQSCLAHIWGLCDTNQTGKLTSDQFALAMWLVERKRNGIEPPQVLSPNMIPPSFRSGPITPSPIPPLPPSPHSINNGDLLSNTSLIQPDPPQPTYSNPELEMISKEIEELAKERRILETDIAQKEADIRIKTGEVNNLEDDLNKLSGTLKQLEVQKGEAQKRLDDLKSQKTEYDAAISSINQEIEITRNQVNKFREQCQKQEVTIKDQENELETKRSELQKLKDEESTLDKQYNVGLKELENLTKNLQDTQIQISQIKAMVTQLQENQRQMNDALALCKIAIDENDPSVVSEYSLKLEPEFRDVTKILDPTNNNNNNNNGPKKISFDDETTTSGGFGAATATDPFKSNGFGGGSDPFSNMSNGIGSGVGGFNDMGSSGFDDAFNDGFATHNAFNNKSDPFAAADPFNDKKSQIQSTPADPSKDEFGSDPFAILHAPTTGGQILSPSANMKSGPPPRPESPSPALPPKKAKQPPPRPAPPRPSQGPTFTKPTTTTNDNSMGFADFADFDNKKVTADFVEDPFKDYRYEDPFNIKDPFEEEDLEVNDPFSNSEVKSTSILNSNKNNNIITTTTITTNTAITTTTNHHNDELNKFNSNYNNNNNINLELSKKSINKENNNFADFDAFNNSNDSNINNNDKNKNSFDFFNDIKDPFESGGFQTTTQQSQNKDKLFDDAFGGDDPFLEFNKKNTKNNFNNNNNLFNDDDFDDKLDMKPPPLPPPSSGLLSKDAGGLRKLFPPPLSKNNNSNINNRVNNNNKFEVNLNTPTTNKIQNNLKCDDNQKFNSNTTSNSNAKLSDKFKEDYSDNFDADLEAVIKRSMVEQ